MIRVSTLNELLANLINEVPDLLAALIVDLDGLVIAQQSVEGFDEEIIGAIMSIVERTISKIKRFAETSYGSGTIDTNDFQLFYLELGGASPALFVIVAGVFAKLEIFIPYSYIVAEKVSQLLNNKEVTPVLPKVGAEGNLELSPNYYTMGAKNITGKIIIIGADAVGKTSLVNMYINGIHDEEYHPTIGVNIVEKELQITKSLVITFFLFDFGGLKSFAKVRKNFYDDAKAVIILFDCAKNETFDQISEWIEEARHFIKDSSVSYIIVGNKIDLIEDREPILKKANDLANQYGFRFFPTSASTGEGLDELFMFLTNFASSQLE